MSERPMWADHGGIDFNGRCAWDAWMELKVRDRISTCRRRGATSDDLQRLPSTGHAHR